MDRSTRRFFALHVAAEHAAFVELLSDPKIAKRWAKLCNQWKDRFKKYQLKDSRIASSRKR